MIVMNLNKQQVLDADPRATQQINCMTNLEEKICFLLLRKQKKLCRICKSSVSAIKCE